MEVLADDFHVVFQVFVPASGNSKLELRREVWARRPGGSSACRW